MGNHAAHMTTFMYSCKLIKKFEEHTLLFWLAIPPYSCAEVDGLTEFGLCLQRLFERGADHVCTEVGVLEVAHASHTPVAGSCC